MSKDRFSHDVALKRALPKDSGTSRIMHKASCIVSKYRILHECSCFIEFIIKRVEEKR